MNILDEINIEKLKRQDILNNIVYLNPSGNVLKTCEYIVEYFTYDILFKLNIDDIYLTDYGTISISWYIIGSSDEFSLEIGNNCLGYFSEYNGKDIHRINSINLEECVVEDVVEYINDFHEYER